MMPLSEYRRKKAQHMNTVIDKRCSRKLEFNLGWSDQTEVFYLLNCFNLQEEYFGILSEAYNCFRNLAVQEPSMDMETDTDSVFSSAASVSSASSVDSTGSNRSVSRYRQRYGRGGRVYVDRTLTADEKEDLEKTQLKTVLENPIVEERMKFDPRASEDIHVIELDEFSIEYYTCHCATNSSQITYRARLLPPRPPQMAPGTTIRVSPGNMSSPLMTRPQLSPSTSRTSLNFQTPK